MLSMLKSLVAPKAHAKMILRGSITMESGIKLQNKVRDMGFMGWMRVTRSYVEIELEGSRPKLEAVIVNLQQTPLFSTPMVLTVTWLPYKGQFSTFRVAM
jgi:hypothetical protein